MGVPTPQCLKPSPVPTTAICRDYIILRRRVEGPVRGARRRGHPPLGPSVRRSRLRLAKNKQKGKNRRSHHILVAPSYPLRSTPSVPRQRAVSRASDRFRSPQACFAEPCGAFDGGSVQPVSLPAPPLTLALGRRRRHRRGQGACQEPAQDRGAPGRARRPRRLRAAARQHDGADGSYGGRRTRLCGRARSVARAPRPVQPRRADGDSKPRPGLPHGRGRGCPRRRGDRAGACRGSAGAVGGHRLRGWPREPRHRQRLLCCARRTGEPAPRPPAACSTGGLGRGTAGESGARPIG